MRIAAAEGKMSGVTRWLLPALLPLVILIPEFAWPGFYYADDVRHYFLPNVVEIGNRLLQGDAPWMTLRSWHAGNYIGEGQFGLFNPLNLALYVLCASLNDLGLAALLFAGVYLTLIGSGTYLLARAFGVSRECAWLVAIAFCSSNFLTYWYAASWWNALSGTCWMIWSWLFWRRAIVRGFSGGGNLVGVFISTTFLLSAGWPHGALALVAVLLVHIALFHKALMTPAILGRMIVVSSCCIAASLPSVFPMLLHVAESARGGWGVQGGSVFAGSFEYLLAMSWPSYQGGAAAFFGMRPASPHFYLAWFVMPAVLMMCIPAVRGQLKPEWRFLLITACVLGVLTLGPERFFALRWPLRFLPYAQLCVLLLAALVLDRLDWGERRLVWVWGGYCLLGLVVSSLLSPEGWQIHVLTAMVCLGVLLYTIRYGADHGQRILWLGIGNVLLTFALHLHWPWNGNVGQWSAPLQQNVSTAAHAQTMPDSRLMLMSVAQPCDQNTCLLASGSIGLWEPGRMVNGYTPVGAKPYAQTLGFNLWSWSDSKFVSSILRQDVETGLRLFELMRVFEVRIAGNKLNQAWYKGKGEDWLRSVHDGGEFVYRWQGERRQYPGTVSWIGSGLGVRSQEALSGQRESLTIDRNNAKTPVRVVFARAWYPGYRASLNGQSLPVNRYSDLLVSVLVPAGATGILQLEFLPPGAEWSWPLALVAVSVVIWLVWRERRKKGERP